MVTEISAEASGKVARRTNRDRCVQRTVDLNEADIAAVGAAELTPDAKAEHATKGDPPST